LIEFAGGDAAIRAGDSAPHELNKILGDEASPPAQAAAVHGVTSWRCGCSWNDLFGISLTGDLGHRLSKVFFLCKKIYPASPDIS
jgi:hypothetical protein